MSSKFLGQYDLTFIFMLLSLDSQNCYHSLYLRTFYQIYHIDHQRISEFNDNKSLIFEARIPRTENLFIILDWI